MPGGGFHEPGWGGTAGALLARCDGQVAGYAIYFFTFSTFIGRAGIWLEDVYVRSEFRGRGLGRGLIEAVAKIGAERNCGRYEWTALNWNKHALDFYDRLGAKRMDEWTMLRMNERQLQALAYAFVGHAQQQALAGFYLVAQPCQLRLHASAHHDVFLLHLFFRQRSPGDA